MPVTDLGPIAIIAPHPDDEILGCGGLIAFCGRLGVPLTIIAMTDGEASHPGSRQVSPEQLIVWRADERKQALAELGARGAQVERLGLPDGRMQQLPAATRQRCVRKLTCILARDRIRTLLVTAGNDAHPDHCASYALARRATPPAPGMRTLTYMIWPPPEMVAAGERRSLDIRSVRARKRRAVACFATQLGEKITDDPQGFCMPPALLQRALAECEVFCIAKR